MDDGNGVTVGKGVTVGGGVSVGVRVDVGGSVAVKVNVLTGVTVLVSGGGRGPGTRRRNKRRIKISNSTRFAIMSRSRFCKLAHPLLWLWLGGRTSTRTDGVKSAELISSRIQLCTTR